MITALRARVLPHSQRRTLAELTSDLDFSEGDSTAKRSAFWIMLTLSAVIASAGVVTDSTATVIGAMIIAPLSTPIMAIALSIVKAERIASVLYVLAGGALVVAIGAVFTVFLPSSYDLLSNSQIAGRTSPGLFDLVGAAATGLAGAIALARRDVSAVLPGVAIAISLVPPLAVVGVCLGEGSVSLALGALVLFVSNLLTLVIGGSIVFAALGYTAEHAQATGRRLRRAHRTLALLLIVIAIPLAVQSASSYALEVWRQRVDKAARSWIADTPGAEVDGVDQASTTFIVKVRTTKPLPPVDELMDDLDDQLPDGLTIVVDSTAGREQTAGKTGQ